MCLAARDLNHGGKKALRVRECPGDFSPKKIAPKQYTSRTLRNTPSTSFRSEGQLDWHMRPACSLFTCIAATVATVAFYDRINRQELGRAYVLGKTVDRCPPALCLSTFVMPAIRLYTSPNEEKETRKDNSSRQKTSRQAETMCCDSLCRLNLLVHSVYVHLGNDVQLYAETFRNKFTGGNSVRLERIVQDVRKRK